MRWAKPPASHTCHIISYRWFLHVSQYFPQGLSYTAAPSVHANEARVTSCKRRSSALILTRLNYAINKLRNDEAASCVHVTHADDSDMNKQFGP
jgi:hypothetical protein